MLTMMHPEKSGWDYGSIVKYSEPNVKDDVNEDSNDDNNDYSDTKQL